ncbi:hypothetical protein LXA47_03940 [Massilia sp. P8910]|uniref:hypothetical protein n=1 Tax=Massilia antarctica TaxID=2765360 RepID=UPI001E3DF74D|nr:hypothetical protein [Massilia antarctica]MCE3602749.1 hypothetical protein [Massilia antarctica]
MLVKVALLCEDNGWPMPRHREMTLVPTILGRLEYDERYEKDFRRPVYSARLFSVDRASEVLPQLWDAVFRVVKDGQMTISGFEMDEVATKRTAQSWLIEVQVPTATGP